MTLPYNRKFNSGRQSEQFYNEELHKVFTALKNINYRKNENKGVEPGSILDGALWFDKIDNQLKYWDQQSRSWKCVFSKKFQITDQITNIFTPADPVEGQLWLSNGVLLYFDGNSWQTVKAMLQDDTQWVNSAFENFQLVSPLSTVTQINNTTSGTNNFTDESYIVLKENKAAGSVWKTNTYYKTNNGELDIHVNGLKLDNGLKYLEALLDGTPAEETKTITNKFIIKTALSAGDIVSYRINRNYSDSDDEIITSLEAEEESFKGWNRFYIGDGKWNNNDYSIPAMPYEPEYEADDTTDYSYQYIVPNLNIDKIFIDHSYDENYTELSKIALQYKKSYVHESRISGIHFNPGRLTNLTKRIYLIDKENPSIEKSAYNTEFYGFRRGESAGDFLLPSTSQDTGDYVTSGSNIILNKIAAENYDYVVSITYEFTWVNSNGVLQKYHPGEGDTSFYILNLQDPVSIHVNGMQIEEADYNIDLQDSTVTLNENVDDLDVDAWSPYKKQYGYIRRTEDITGRGIIHLHDSISSADNLLVFVGGQLIHPIYGGLEFDLDHRRIFVPCPDPEVDNLRNVPWCVVDMAVDRCRDCGFTGNIISECPKFSGFNIKRANNNSSMQDCSGSGKAGTAQANIYDCFTIMDDNVSVMVDGTLGDEPDEGNIYDFILAYGYISNINDELIHYDVDKITDDDGVILFVNGLLICPDDLEINRKNGTIHVDGLENGMEYILLRDPECRMYKPSDMMQAYSIGVLSDSIVYLNGKLILNEDCFSTTQTEDKAIYSGAVNNEIRCFITDEYNDIKSWKIFDAFEYTWKNLDEIKTADLKNIAASYLNLLTTVQIKIDHTGEDDIRILAFKFANTVSGYYKTGTAVYQETDETDGLPIFSIAPESFTYGLNTLNLYKNGVKLLNNVHYKELITGNQIKLLTSFEEDELGDLLESDEKIYTAWKKQTGLDEYISETRDTLQYVIEPIENGENEGYISILMTKENALQPNIYKLEENDDDLYPGRITVYVNGVRLSNKDWVLIDNRHIMLKYNDYIACGSGDNFPEEIIAAGENVFSLTHKHPDYITVEIRKDYDRRETTIDYNSVDGIEIYLDECNIPIEILDTADEILFFLNGQYTGITRRSTNDYRIDKYKGCITLLNPELISLLKSEKNAVLFNDSLVYGGWKKQTGLDEYDSNIGKKLTLVWRT